MPILLADFIYSRDCKLNLRKNVDTTFLTRPEGLLGARDIEKRSVINTEKPHPVQLSAVF